MKEIKSNPEDNTKNEQIEIELVPGVSAFQVAAAYHEAELTIPDVTQTIILTRAAG